jgi:hypothetical protein
VPELLAPLIGRVALPAAVCRRVGLPAGTRLGDVPVETLKNGSKPDTELLVEQAAHAARNRWDILKRDRTRVRFTRDSVKSGAPSLSRRTYNVMGRMGLLDLEEPQDLAMSAIVRTTGVGSRTLLEMLTLAIATPDETRPPVRSPDPRRTRSRAVKTAADKLARTRWSPLITREDLRLGAMFDGLPPLGGNMRSLALALGDAGFTPSEAKAAKARLRSVIVASEALRRLTVETEAEQLIQATSPRSVAGREGVRIRLGLTTGEPTTLQEAASASGITRERVRQVEQALRQEVQAGPTWTPALDRAIAHVTKNLPARTDEVRRELFQLGMTDGMSLDAILSLASVYGHDAPFEIDRERELVYTGDSPIDAVESTARRLVAHWGVTTVDELRRELQNDGVALEEPSLKLHITALDDSVWLDDDRSWFWIRGLPRNRLLNQIEKIMSVAGSLTIGELRDGVGRHHRMRAFRPPRDVLARLCEETGLYAREGDEIVELPGQLRSWQDALADNEELLADVLFENGPVMRREDLERIACDERGLNRSSFYVYLTYSPIIARFAPGVYGLRGARVTAGAVNALIPPRIRKQRLQDHGWTASGEVWIAYEVSPTSAHSGVVSLPGALRDVISGSFALHAEDGRPVGTLGIRGHAMWGLSPFFRRWGVEEGDYILVTLDPVKRSAAVTAGTQEEVLLKYQEGE